MSTQPLYRLIDSRGWYWRHGGQGYTADVSEAGLFSDEYSAREVESCHGEVVRDLAGSPFLDPKPTPEAITEVRKLVEEIAGYAEVFAGDVGSRSPSQREAIVGTLRVRHVLQAEKILALLNRQ